LKKKRKREKKPDYIWLLAEERPKPTVVLQIIKAYCEDFGDSEIHNNNIKIKPIIKNGVFQFKYRVKGIKVANAKKIYIKIIRGYSSSVDYLLFKQRHQPCESDPSEIPLMAIEETKTNEEESRNTYVPQRVSKFVYFRHFYKDVKMYMLYNDEFRQTSSKKPYDTTIFGTNILLTLGVKFIGRDISRWFSPFSSVEEAVEFKSKMKKAHKGDVAIEITKFEDRIEVSGRLSNPVKKQNIAHDPGIGSIAMIGAGLRFLGWQGEILIKNHGVSQEYVSNNKSNKFLYICKILDMSLDGLVMPSVEVPKLYWCYEKKSEKVASILLHLACEYCGISCIYENHARCERGFFRTNDDELIALPKEDSNGDKLLLPDVVLKDDDEMEVYDVEGKKLSTLKDGIKEVETYDGIEREYINKYYPNHQIQRWVCIFGGKRAKIPHEKVMLYLNNDGNVYINASAPKNIKSAFKKLGGYFE